MTLADSTKKGLVLAGYVLWGGALIVGSIRTHRAFVILYRLNQKTQAMTRTLQDDSARIPISVQAIRFSKREIEFLQSLANVLPQSKSFIRTQEAMQDEVALLRTKAGKRVKNELHILVDTKANKLYVKKGLTLLWEADCSVGKGRMLTDKATGRRWEFVTPRGQFEVHEKIEKPFWTKPDWAFVEAGEKIPPPEDPSRHVEGELGAYVFNLGDGYLIHGTRNEALLGRPMSHGCVRLGALDLQKLYELAPKGTKVYIY